MSFCTTISAAEAAHLCEQDKAAMLANYRVAWDQDRGGYFGQFLSGVDLWTDCRPGVTHSAHVEAVLDCKLLAAALREPCLLHPKIALIRRATS